MRAMVINQTGGVEVFQATDLPLPNPAKGQVRIKVKASSLNPLDIKIRSGAVAAGPDFPAILGLDVGGIIDAIGEDVTQFKIGDAVIGCAGGLKGTQGALADYMLADARLLSLAPNNLSLEKASVLPLVFLTAYDALVEKTQLKAGQSILIHGGTGGVGHVAIQLVKALKAKVFTSVSSPEKAKLAKQLGADVVINYREQTPESYLKEFTNNQGFDVVFDTVGGEVLNQSFLAAKNNGQVVSINTRSAHDLSQLHSKALSLHVVFKALPLLTGEGRDAETKKLAYMCQLIENNQLNPLIASQQFGFHQIAAAHTYLESGQARGKVLLTHQGI